MNGIVKLWSELLVCVFHMNLYIIYIGFSDYIS